jgi:hypothetical protein
MPPTTPVVVQVKVGLVEYAWASRQVLEPGAKSQNW